MIQLPDTLQQAAPWLSQRLSVVGPDSALDNFPAEVRPAAVLMAMLWHASMPTILLTRRAADLAHHAGQISFPGGKLEPTDASAVDAALREAYEEIGLPQQQVQVIGTMPCYLTVSDFLITPVVALVEPPTSFILQRSEVDEVFEVPLQLALDPAAYRSERVLHGSRQVEIKVLDYQGHRIWGATARMLYQLAQVVGDDALTTGPGLLRDL